jgi:4-hydroxyphenylacetate 3-monooxygenase
VRIDLISACCGSSALRAPHLLIATYTALHRAVLLQMAWDYVASALDGHASAFEWYASGSVPAWRGWLRRSFERYNALANTVLRALNMDIPDIDLSSLREVPWAPRRTVTPPAPPPIGPGPL